MVSATEKTPLNAGAQLKYETQLSNVAGILWVENCLFCSCDEERASKFALRLDDTLNGPLSVGFYRNKANVSQFLIIQLRGTFFRSRELMLKLKPLKG